MFYDNIQYKQGFSLKQTLTSFQIVKLHVSILYKDLLYTSK
jgi:hypothetical protein